MEIILLETVGRLGSIGDRARVRPGYARNYLFPRKMALPSNEQSMKWLEQHRAELEKQQLERESQATQLAAKISEVTLDIEASCGPEGQLHGSVTAGDIVAAAAGHDIELSKSMIRMPEQRITYIGEHEIVVHLAAGAEATMKLNVVAKAAQD